MKKYFKEKGGKNIEFVTILSKLLKEGLVIWMELDTESSELTWRSLELAKDSKYIINTGNPTYSQSKSVIFNTKDLTLAIEAKSEKDTIPMYYRFEVSESELEDLFEGTTFEFKKF